MLTTDEFPNARPWTDEQRRQFVDARQVLEAWELVHEELRHRFAGSIRWVTRRGHEYLHRKVGERETSLGRRSAETEESERAFLTGRAAAQARATALTARLEAMAPVNRALQLGRMPRLFSRIARRLGEADLLGKHLLVVGTHALYAYEAAAGVHLASDLLATGDADLLWDARLRLSLVVPEIRREGVLALLQRVDHSFALRGPRDFRAFNKDGFWVDLLRPRDRTFLAPSARSTIGENPADLHPAPLGGQNWLLNVPKFTGVVMSSDGYPVRVATVDPRAFALHKAWLATRPDRDPVKVQRDRHQARAAAWLAQRHLGLAMDDEVLRGLPEQLRSLAAGLTWAADWDPGQGPNW